MRTYLAFFWKKLPLAAFLCLSFAALSQTQSITWSAVGDYGSSTQNFCRAAEGYFECQALSNYKFGITTKQRGTLSASNLNFGVHINNTAAPYKIDFLQNGVVTGSYLVNPAATDKIKMERQGSLLYVYHYVAATGLSTLIQIFETDANLTYRAMAIKTPAGTFTALAAVASSSLTQGCNPGTTAINETDRNWEHLKLYDADQDGTGLIGETRGYSDKFGHLTQQQQRHFPTETVLATESVFDAHGRQVLSTLPAPTANTSIQYVPNFIQNTSGAYYNFTNFDTPGTLNNPAPLGAAAGTVGYYYSNNNSAEPYAPSSQYPYSRVEYALDGSVKRSSGIGEAYRMGSGHETRMFYVNAGAELGFLYGGRKSYEVDWAAGTPLAPAPKDIGQNIVALKSVTVNPDGTETIAYKSLSGLLLATCASGKAENCTNGQVARHKLYDNKAPSSLNEYGTASVKIHLPAAKRTTLQLLPDKGYGINAYYLAGGNVANLFSFSIYDLNNNAVLTAGADYTISFDPANWRFQVSFSGPYNSSTQSRFLHISFAYTNLYYSVAYTNYIPGYEPPLMVKYELDYSNWSLNYYDDKGLLRMSVPPKGIDCSLGDPSKYSIKSYSKYSDFYTINAGNYQYNATPFQVETVPMDQSEVSGSNMGTELAIRLRAMVKPGIRADEYAKDYSPTFANAADFIDIAVPPSPKKPTGGGGYLSLPAAGFDALFSPLPAAQIETNAANTTVHFRETAEGPASTSALCRNGMPDIGEIRTDQGGVCGNTGNTPCSDSTRFLVAFRFRVSIQNPGGTELAWGYLYRSLGSDCHNLFLEIPNPDGPAELAFALNNAQINGATNILTKITEVKVKETQLGGYSASFNAAIAHHRLIRYFYLLFDATRERYLVNPVPHSMVQTYHYDALDRLIATQDPDRGKTEYIYDDEGKLRFVQDAAQRALAASPTNISAFSYLDYDREGRVVETGEYYRSTTGGAGTYHYFPNAYYLPTATCPPGDAYHIYCNANLRNAAGALSFASGNTRNKSSLTYDFLNPALSLPAGVSAAYRPMFAEGRLALSANENHKTWYRYNHRGELTASVQQHLGLGAYDIGAVTHDYEYDYFGRLKRSLLQKGNASGQFEEVYLYNDAGELVTIESKKGTSGTRIKHARNSYYKTGPLKRRELGNRLQGLDYVYTIDGALKSLNHPQLNSADPGKDGYAGANSAVRADVFGYALDYYPADYVRSNTSISYGSSYGATNERYDGRIKGLRWNTRYPGLTASAGSEHMYKYDYDWKQQLKTTEFGVYTPNSTTNNAAGAGGYASPVYGSFVADAQSRYKEDNLSYDLNGNLSALRRYGVPQGSTPTQIDNLTAYTLQSGTNRLSSVTEASAFTDPAINDVRPQSAGNYTYYDNGALKTDLANDLSLEYNAAGLTTAVRNAAGTQLKLSFVYDEQGQRIRKVEYTAGTLSKTTLYLRGPEGGLCAVYEAPAAGAYVQKELLLDGGALGAYYGDQVNRYVYALTDHLGNVRATVDRDLSGGNVQQLSYADYYAWGMPLPGREAASSPRYRLGYQGQEYESKVGLYGFGLRLYDQRLGRWLSADPYGQHWSPYLAMSNNPVSFVDADGGWDGWWDRNSVSYFVDGFEVDAGMYNLVMSSPGHYTTISYSGSAAMGSAYGKRDELIYNQYYHSWGYWLDPDWYLIETTIEIDPESGIGTGTQNLPVATSKWMGVDLDGPGGAGARHAESFGFQGTGLYGGRSEFDKFLDGLGGSILGTLTAFVEDVTGANLPAPAAYGDFGRGFVDAAQNTHKYMMVFGAAESALGLFASKGGRFIAPATSGGGLVISGGGVCAIWHGTFVMQNAWRNMAKGVDGPKSDTPKVSDSAAKGGANIGTKLEYVFGEATGSAHNIERSTGMLRQLESVGIFNNAAGRSLLNSHLESVYSGTKGILQSNGRYLRESLLMGPRGGLKVESIWEGNNLITVKLLGGR